MKTKLNKVVLPSFKVYGETKEELAQQELKDRLNTQINLSALPRIESGKHPIILLRNSRSAVKRAKMEFKQESKLKNYETERSGVIHQMVNSNPRFNLVLLVN